MAALTSNKITADGSYTIPTLAGQVYTFSVAGSFGGGSLAIKWIDAAGNSTAFSQSPVTAAASFAVRAPSDQVELVLTGSTSPLLTIGLTISSQQSPPISSEIADLISGSAEATSLVDANKFAVIVSGALKWISWANIKSVFGLLTGNNTWSGANTYTNSAHTINASNFSAPNATFNSEASVLNAGEMLRFLVDQPQLIEGHAITSSGASSGAGASSAASGIAKWGWLLTAGTTAAGRASVKMLENWASFNAEGTIGWNFAKPFTVTGFFFMSNVNTSAEGVHRFYLGAGLANDANSNMFSDDGVGFEVATAKGGGANTYARLTWHNGSTYSTGPWIQIFSGAIPDSRAISFKITNNGSGGLAFWIKPAGAARNGPPSLSGLTADYTTSSGSTGTTPQFMNSIIWSSENNSTSYTASLGGIYLGPIRFLHQ